MGSKTFDLVDGGIPAVFLDGPKKGHVGVVDPDEGMPPATLTFLDDLVYMRVGRTTVRAQDSYLQPVKYRGVGYKVDRRCGFMAKLRLADQEARAAATAHRIETGEIKP